VNRQEKIQSVEELQQLLTDVTSLVVTDYRGLDVGKMFELRNKLRESGVQYRVVKNTLARRAVSDTDKAFLADHFVGPTAIAWSDEDPVAPAKVLADYAKEHEELEIKVGYLAGNGIDVQAIMELAKLPGKDELRSKFLSVLNAPATKMVTLLSQVPRNFLLVCKQREAQLDEQG
jgi:large subunit ribosomal protein L10